MVGVIENCGCGRGCSTTSDCIGGAIVCWGDNDGLEIHSQHVLLHRLMFFNTVIIPPINVVIDKTKITTMELLEVSIGKY